MTYATVMVGLSINQPNEGRLEIAGQLAERFGAKLIGITAAEFSISRQANRPRSCLTRAGQRSKTG